jgi:hypothetical protein
MCLNFGKWFQEKKAGKVRRRKLVRGKWTPIVKRVKR